MVPVSFTMRVFLLVNLVALCHWGIMGLPSAQDEAQVCCSELEKLAKKYPDEAYDDLLEDCTTWLTDMRTSYNTKCPVPVHVICDNLYCQKTNNVTSMPLKDNVTTLAQNNVTTTPKRDPQSSERVTVRNILRVVDTQNWHNCVIVYDVSSWRPLHLLTSSLSERNIYFITYDVVKVKDTSDLRVMLQKTFSVYNLKNIIVLSADVTFCAKLFREAENYDRSLGRTSGLRMFTRWLVTTSSGLENELARAATYFDNVAAIVESPDTIVFPNYTHTGPWQGVWEVDCVMTEISTLMYTDTNGSREFQTSTALIPSGDIIVDDAYPNIRHGFNMRPLTVSTKTWYPFVNREESINGTRTYSGLCMDILRELARVLNFTYEVVELPSSEGWGNMNASGHWEGLVGQLYREEVDLVVAPLTFTPERALVMDATYPFYTSHLSAVYRKPDPDLDKWRTYLRPFKGEVLLCLAATLLTVTCLVHVLAWLHPDRQAASRGGGREGTQGRKRRRGVVPFPGPSPDDGFWYLYGALFSQGGSVLPMTGSGRMLVASWWLFCMVMGATYSGNLIAYLTVQLETRPFDSFSQILNQDRYVLGVPEKSSLWTIFMDSQNKVLGGIGRRVLDHASTHLWVVSNDFDEQMQRIMAGGYVQFTESATGDALVWKNCELDQVIDHDSMDQSFVVALPRGSAYTRLFDLCVMRVVEAGLLAKWKGDWFADFHQCSHSSISGSPSITVLDVQSALFLCVLGLGLALTSMALECLCHRFPRLRFWASTVSDSCVSGCDTVEDPQTKRGSTVDGNRDDPASADQLYGGIDNYGRSRNAGNTSGGELYGIYVTVDDHDDGGGRGKQLMPISSGLLDPSCAEQRQHFLFDTAYSRPEDFRRDPSENLYPGSAWVRRGSRLVCITDDPNMAA